MRLLGPLSFIQTNLNAIARAHIDHRRHCLTYLACEDMQMPSMRATRIATILYEQLAFRNRDARSHLVISADSEHVHHVH